MAALEFVYGDCFWQKLRPIQERIWDPTSRADDSKRKYLNWPTAAEDSWTTKEAWSACADPTQTCRGRRRDRHVLRRIEVAATPRPSSAAGISDGHVFTIGVWEPDIAHTS